MYNHKTETVDIEAFLELFGVTGKTAAHKVQFANGLAILRYSQWSEDGESNQPSASVSGRSDQLVDDASDDAADESTGEKSVQSRVKKGK